MVKDREAWCAAVGHNLVTEQVALEELLQGVALDQWWPNPGQPNHLIILAISFLFLLALPCGMQDPNFQIRDWNWAPCSEILLHFHTL